MKKSLLSLSFVAFLLLQSCASILTGTSEMITIQSDPPGARILLDAEPLGLTPSTIRVKRNVTPTFSLLLDGYDEKQIVMRKKFNPAAILNIFVGGIIGIIIDAATGAIGKFDKTSYFMELREQQWHKDKAAEGKGF